MYITTEGIGEPVIGDIQLVPSTRPGYYQPLVYFTNGIEPPQWGSICYDNIIKADARVICNQVGFELDDTSPFMGAEYVRFYTSVKYVCRVIHRRWKELLFSGGKIFEFAHKAKYE